MICSHCKSRDVSISHVRSCATQKPVAPTTYGYGHSSADSATGKQLDFIRTLREERGLNVTDPIPGGCTKRDASALIESLLKMPKTAPLPPEEILRPYPSVPAGHYAIKSLTGNNDLDFFRVDRPTEGPWKDRTFVKQVIGGHPEFAVRGRRAIEVLEAILAAGTREAAVLYGREIGRCYVCNRTLTDDASRAAGIGPVCSASF